VAPLLASGQFVPDEITIPLVRRVIETDGGDGFVLDGYPRNIAQAAALDDMLDEIDRPLSIILLLQTDDAVSRERLAKRAHLEGRTDDTPEAINRRLSDYHEKTEPVVEHYRSSGNLVQVHAERSIEEVWAEIARVLEQVEARA
jgi:adenylate kinase